MINIKLFKQFILIFIPFKFQQCTILLCSDFRHYFLRWARITWRGKLLMLYVSIKGSASFRASCTSSIIWNGKSALRVLRPLFEMVSQLFGYVFRYLKWYVSSPCTSFIIWNGKSALHVLLPLLEMVSQLFVYFVRYLKWYVSFSCTSSIIWNGKSALGLFIRHLPRMSSVCGHCIIISCYWRHAELRFRLRQLFFISWILTFEIRVKSSWAWKILVAIYRPTDSFQPSLRSSHLHLLVTES